MNLPFPFVLASASPRRKELIRILFEDPIIDPADVDETVTDDVKAEDQPAHLALRKGLAVSDKYPEALVLGCDTSVILDGKVLGKPKTKEDAFAMLRFLSGRTHTVVTGCALIKNKKVHTFSEKTEVTFYKLTDEDIQEYIATNEPMDKAGAYGIQGLGMVLVKKINGDYTNVVGMPVPRLKKEIEKFIKKADS